MAKIMTRYSSFTLTRWASLDGLLRGHSAGRAAAAREDTVAAGQQRRFVGGGSWAARHRDDENAEALQTLQLWPTSCCTYYSIESTACQRIEFLQTGEAGSLRHEGRQVET